MSNARITATAKALGYTTTTENNAIIARDTNDQVRIYAAYNGRRFDYGFTVDSMGHNTHHDTITDLIAYAG